VLLRGGSYGPVRFTTQRSKPVRFRPYPGERVVLNTVNFDAGGARLQGFRITGAVNVASGVRGVALVGNRWSAPGNALNIEYGAARILIAGNRISQTRSNEAVNLINFNSTDTQPQISDVTIRGNRIGPVASGGDAIQAKHTRNLRVEDNEFSGVRLPPGSDAHPDVLQSIYGSTGLSFKRNFIHDVASQGLFVQAFRGVNTNVTATDNVVVRVAYPWTAFILDIVGSNISHNTVDGVMRIGATSRQSKVQANIATYGLLTDPGAQVAPSSNLAQRFTGERGPGSVQGKPRFRNPRRDDYRLRRRSAGRRRAPGRRDIGSLYLTHWIRR
jgi:hypothetical protein